MNKRRQGSNLSLPTLLVLLVAGMIVSGGGISYVMVKNKQITTLTEKYESIESSLGEMQAELEEAIG